jgi:hypothetical protein
LFLEITNIDPVYENKSIEIAIEERHYDILELLLQCDGANYKKAKRFANKYGDQKTRDIIKNIKK